MLEWLRALHRRSLDQGGEGPMLVDAIRAGCHGAGARVLDVGCGYGRNLRALRAAGIAATGVEINPAIVAANRRDGLDCVGVDEFDSAEGMFEVILMAHIIEHFAPSDLLKFIDHYLDRLAVGGRLVIATPLMSKYFYDDFDHVKPYQPAGLMMVFGAGSAQVQYYARNRLKLVDLRFRRAPLRISYARSRYVRTPVRFALMAADLACGAAFFLTAGIIGRTDGWIGVFEKTGASQ